jgi:hypothetical protein|nr:MAG TPA: hypothetical protein [Caudoviricetes sp.]
MAFLWEWLVGLPFYHDKAREPDGGRDRKEKAHAVNVDSM